MSAHVTDPPDIIASVAGALDVVELGPRYLPGARLPQRPGPWVAGVAWLDDGTIACTDWRGGAAHVVDPDSGREFGSVPGLHGPRGVHAVPGGRFVVCEPERQRLTVCSSSGIVAQIGTGEIKPWYAALWRGGWLIVDAGSNEVHLLVDGISRRIPLGYEPHALRSAVPGGADTFVLCDQGGHVVTELTVSGEVIRQLGTYLRPAGLSGSFIGPEHALPMPDGSVVVTDTRSNQIVRATWDGGYDVLVGGGGMLGADPGLVWSPIAAASGPGGKVAVADAANGRVVVVNPDGTTRSVWGTPVVASFAFQYPRSQQPTERGFLVADSYHNRIVEIDPAGSILREFTHAGGVDFFWPRFATCIEGVTFLCDSRNGRILRCREEGSLEPFTLTLAGRTLPVRDPHTIRQVPGGLLLTDTKSNRVVRATLEGEVRDLWEGPPSNPDDDARGTVIDAGLKDIHDADLTRAGSLWVADTGHSRLVHLSCDGDVLHVMQSLTLPDGSPASPLSYPRTVEVLDECHLLVTDSGNHRVVVLDTEGRIIWSYGSGARGHAHGCLSDPRHAAWYGARTVLISDYGNNRLLRVPGPELAPQGADTSRGHHDVHGARSRPMR